MTVPTWSDEPPEPGFWYWCYHPIGDEPEIAWFTKHGNAQFVGTNEVAVPHRVGPRIPTPDELASLYEDRERLKRLTETAP